MLPPALLGRSMAWVSAWPTPRPGMAMLRTAVLRAAMLRAAQGGLNMGLQLGLGLGLGL